MQNVAKNHAFGRKLTSFCHYSGLVISDMIHLQNCYTFVSSEYHTTSSLDHVVHTASANYLVHDFKVHHDKISSDHLPLSMSVNIRNIPCCCAPCNNNQCKTVQS